MAISVSGSQGRVYSVELHTNGSVSCTCAAWKHQRRAANNRTCKHIEQLVLVIGTHHLNAVGA